jgi:hypothetical protein
MRSRSVSSIPRRVALTAAALTTALLGAPLTDALSAQQTDSARIAELERRLDAISVELERLSLGIDVVQADSSIMGLGPAASKVYQVTQGVSIGGYGEILYENFDDMREDDTPATSLDVIDALRAIVYFGYKFDDRLLFNSEVEIEHANEAYLEFAYLDYMLTESVGVRAGLLLAPLGLVNELHEPPVFIDAKRSFTENRIIPTTWRENGIGLFGNGEALTWRLYVMNSLNGAGFNASGLRGGRQRGIRALSESMGIAGRADYVGMPGLMVGASGFFGGTGQGREIGGERVDANLLVWDAHLHYEAQGFDVRALVSGASLDDAAELNQLNALAGAAGVGDEMLGWYVEAGYDVLSRVESEHQLHPFARYEKVNTHQSVVPGFTAGPADELTAVSLGTAWRPAPQVVLKVARQLISNEAETGTDQWNVQLGWLF